MRLEIETITPERAAALLAAAEEAGQRQRRISEARVRKFEHAIRSNQWRVTHQGIALDDRGILIDGQHRLTAVVRADSDVRMSVLYDADPETFDVIDTGGARTVKDAAQIAGFNNAGRATSVARILLGAQAVRGTSKTIASVANELTIPDVMAALHDDRTMNAIETALPDSASVARAWGRFGAQNWVGAAFAEILLAGADREQYNDFVEKLRLGVMLEQDSSIMALRRYTIGVTQLWAMPSNGRSTVGTAVVIKAWNEWLSDRRRASMKFALGTEAFPTVQIAPVARTRPADMVAEVAG